MGDGVDLPCLHSLGVRVTSGVWTRQHVEGWVPLKGVGNEFRRWDYSNGNWTTEDSHVYLHDVTAILDQFHLQIEELAVQRGVSASEAFLKTCAEGVKVHVFLCVTVKDRSSLHVPDAVTILRSAFMSMFFPALWAL